MSPSVFLVHLAANLVPSICTGPPSCLHNCTRFSPAPLHDLSAKRPNRQRGQGGQLDPGFWLKPFSSPPEENPYPTMLPWPRRAAPFKFAPLTTPIHHVSEALVFSSSNIPSLSHLNASLGDYSFGPEGSLCSWDLGLTQVLFPDRDPETISRSVIPEVLSPSLLDCSPHPNPSPSGFFFIFFERTGFDSQVQRCQHALLTILGTQSPSRAYLSAGSFR